MTINEKNAVNADVTALGTKLNILVFTAHPDDHVPCVGTLLKLNQLGFELYECLFTNGEASGLFANGTYTSAIDPVNLTQVRSDEFKCASKLLGTKEVFLLNQPNLGIQKSVELYKTIVGIIRKVKPFIVFMHGPNDYNEDHTMVYEICQMALRMTANPQFLELGPRFRVPIVLCFDGLFLSNPSILVDISDVLSDKEKVSDCYKSQMPKDSMGYKVEGAISTYRGYQRSVVNKLGKSGQASEGFTVPEKFPIAADELFDLFSKLKAKNE